MLESVRQKRIVQETLNLGPSQKIGGKTMTKTARSYDEAIELLRLRDEKKQGKKGARQWTKNLVRLMSSR